MIKPNKMPTTFNLKPKPLKKNENDYFLSQTETETDLILTAFTSRET
jgi:hypothetical protein